MGDSPGPSPGPSMLDAHDDEPQDGWLGSSNTATVESQPNSGWLADGGGPSMAEMVDRAIGEEEADDFVDDSWVDEEIREGEYDDLEVPDEYTPPAPEVGGIFVKMLLVAILVLLVGGGMMFLKKDTKTSEEIAAEERQEARKEALTYLETGQTQIEEGNPDAAVHSFKFALEKFNEIEAPEKQVLDTKVLLGDAYMEAGEYADAHTVWKELARAPDEYQEISKEGLKEANKGLRVQALDMVAEANEMYEDGEATAVIKMGREALEMFEKYGGSKVQQGKAHVVIGRGMINGYNYGEAEKHIRTAMAYHPDGGYDADLRELKDAVAAKRPSRRRNARPKNVQKKVVKVNANFRPDASYKKATGVVRRSGRRTSSASGPAPAAAPAPAQPTRRMIEVKAYQAPTQQRSSGARQRKGQQGVVGSYNSK